MSLIPITVRLFPRCSLASDKDVTFSTWTCLLACPTRLAFRVILAEDSRERIEKCKKQRKGRTLNSRTWLDSCWTAMGRERRSFRRFTSQYWLVHKLTCRTTHVGHTVLLSMKSKLTMSFVTIWFALADNAFFLKRWNRFFEVESILNYINLAVGYIIRLVCSTYLLRKFCNRKLQN